MIQLSVTESNAKTQLKMRENAAPGPVCSTCTALSGIPTCIFIGIHVVYDLSRAPGSRVVSLEVLCTACRVPAYVPLQMDEIYNVTLPSYMLFGGDGYSMLKEKNLGYSKGKGDTVQVSIGTSRVVDKQFPKIKRSFYSTNLRLFAFTQWLNVLLLWQLRFGCRQQLHSFSVKTTKVFQQCLEISSEIAAFLVYHKVHTEYILHCLAFVLITEQGIKKKGAIFYRP